MMKDTTRSQAQDALKSIQDAQQSLIQESRPSVWIRLIIASSLGSIIFGYGMTEHDNTWALAIWGGAIAFVLSSILYVYIYRVQGIKLSFLPKSSESEKLNVYVAFIFAFLASGSRLLRTEFDWSYSPHLCALLSAALFFWIQSRYPTGEIVNKEQDNG